MWAGGCGLWRIRPNRAVNGKKKTKENRNRSPTPENFFFLLLFGGVFHARDEKETKRNSREKEEREGHAERGRPRVCYKNAKS